jgi:hypothetical protein
MTDNNQDRSQDEGQQGIDRETEQRNRENESGQSGGQQGGQSQFGQPGQSGQQDKSAGGDTSLQDRASQTGGQSSTGLGSSEQSGGQSDTGFVGAQGDQSSDYLTKSDQGEDFAADGQGAQDSDSGLSDVETGQSQANQSDFDDGSDNDR